jgi:hypothetical protein
MIYTTWINLDSQKERADVLYQIKDSSILVVDYILNKRDLLSGKCLTRKIEYKNIGIIKIRNKNSVPIWALSGLIAGSLAGAIIGHTSYHYDPTKINIFTAKDNEIAGAVFGGLLGLGIGAATGTFRIEIPINRSIENFNKNKERLKKYSYIH